jgi:hypothetical protein
MTDFRGNIDHWLKYSEPDYYIFFLKAWIPFNAWYVAELPHLEKKDTKIIKELQDNINSKPRNIIENYLSNNKSDANKFKSPYGRFVHSRTGNKTQEPVINNKELTIVPNPAKK